MDSDAWIKWIQSITENFDWLPSRTTGGHTSIVWVRFCQRNGSVSSWSFGVLREVPSRDMRNVSGGQSSACCSLWANKELEMKSAIMPTTNVSLSSGTAGLWNERLLRRTSQQTSCPSVSLFWWCCCPASMLDVLMLLTATERSWPFFLWYSFTFDRSHSSFSLDEVSFLIIDEPSNWN